MHPLISILQHPSSHSGTQYPDASNAKYSGAGVVDQLKDDAWLSSEFITTVQKRGAAIIKARKLSSAMSAAKAICDHVRDWWSGTSEDSWVSMGVSGWLNKCFRKKFL